VSGDPTALCKPAQFPDTRARRKGDPLFDPARSRACSTTLPNKIFSAIGRGVNSQINALSTIIVGIAAVGVISASLTTKQRAIRFQLEEQTAARVWSDAPPPPRQKFFRARMSMASK